MLALLDTQALSAGAPDRNGGQASPACLLAALIDALTSPERYGIEVHDGELFITLARGRAEPQRAAFRAAGEQAAIGPCEC